MADISLIVGSGLSIPAGFPSASVLNNRLSKIDSGDISIHTDGSAWFLNGQTDPNAHWMHVKERNFIQKFLEFYCEHILENKNTFHYEEFYDYYQGLIETQEYSDELNTFYEEFLDGGAGDSSKTQMLHDFNRYFNQLIENLLFKKFVIAHLCEPYHSSCSAFLLLLEKLGEQYIVNIHSLNHDLYIEHLSVSDSIQAQFDDGFEEVDSPYYGKYFAKYVSYTVRLSRFTNKYSQTFKLFKLHGSIDHYWFGYDNHFDLLKLKYGISPNDIYKEIINNNKKEYVNEHVEIYPDFLSGKTYKIKRYNRGSYYPTVFEHFNSNLDNSKNLIIIGYGFGDEEINNYIEKFSNSSNKKIFVVDIIKPNSDLLDKENAIYIEGGVVNMDYNYILENLA